MKGNDKLRVQYPFEENAWLKSALIPVLDAALRDALDKKLIVPEHKLRQPVMLFSQAKCKKQLYHRDLKREAEDAKVVPLSLFVALQENTKLALLDDKQIIIQPGDYIIFGSRLVHAGEAYETDHVRLHAYLAAKDFKIGNQTDYV